MSVVLPKEIAYLPSLQSLPPDTINTSVVISPSNGSVFSLGSGAVIQLDLPARGFLDPKSMYLRYTWNITVPVISGNVASGNYTAIMGTPLYSCINRVETIFGSNIVETIQNYGVVQNMLIANSLNYAQKIGLGVCLGYLQENDSATNQINGRVLTCGVAGSVYSFQVCGPINCLLANCEHLFPLFASSNVRIQLSLDSIANVIKAVGTNTLPTNVTISNVELCFDMVDFGSGVESMVKSMGDKFYIKSESYAVATQNLPQFSGTAELNYNLRLSSIKSLWAINGGTSSFNGGYDSFDLTQRSFNYTSMVQSGGGDYSFSVASKSYPDRPLSTFVNKPAVFLESQFAKGHACNDVGIADNSIYPVQFNYANNSTTTTIIAPAQFFFSVNTEKLRSNNYLLSGVSTSNSAITYRVNTGSTSTGSANNVSLVAVYDALIEIDPIMRNATVKQ